MGEGAAVFFEVDFVAQSRDGRGPGLGHDAVERLFAAGKTGLHEAGEVGVTAGLEKVVGLFQEKTALLGVGAGQGGEFAVVRRRALEDELLRREEEARRAREAANSP
jgi:hypothetical protein